MDGAGAACLYLQGWAEGDVQAAATALPLGRFEAMEMLISHQPGLISVELQLINNRVKITAANPVSNPMGSRVGAASPICVPSMGQGGGMLQGHAPSHVQPCTGSYIHMYIYMYCIYTYMYITHIYSLLALLGCPPAPSQTHHGANVPHPHGPAWEQRW